MYFKDTPRLQPVAISCGSMVGVVLAVNESSPVNFTFAVDSNPPPDENSFVWFKDGVFVGSGRYLALSRAGRLDAGTYTCNVTNTMAPSGGAQSIVGYGSGSLQLSVLCKFIGSFYVRVRTITAQSSMVVTIHVLAKVDVTCLNFRERATEQALVATVSLIVIRQVTPPDSPP